MYRFAHHQLSAPPEHLLMEVDAAWERSQDLIAGTLELHFTRSPRGRVRGELRAPGGELVSPLTAAEALAFACGDVGVAHVTR